MQRLPFSYGLALCGAAVSLTLVAQFTSDAFAVLAKICYGLGVCAMLPSAAFELPRRAISRVDVVDTLFLTLLAMLAAVALCVIEAWDCLGIVAFVAVWGYGFLACCPLWDIIVPQFRSAGVVAPTSHTSRVAKLTTTTPRHPRMRECATEPRDTVTRKRTDRRNMNWERDPPSVRVVVPTRNEVMVAPPGDLFLAEKIAQIQQSINEFDDHLRVNYEFIREKAQREEFDGEWEIARKQKYQTEMAKQRLIFQKEQYDEQQSESALTVDRNAVNILGHFKRAEGFAVYTIVVCRKDNEGRIKAGWAVPRRYSEFAKLHEQLRTKDHRVREMAFPSKLLFRNMDDAVLEWRRRQLLSYLTAVMQIPEIVNCEEIRRFLCKDSS